MPLAVDDKRIARITYPTAAYSLEQRHIIWVRTEAQKDGKSASAYLRSLLDKCIADAETKESAA